MKTRPRSDWQNKPLKLPTELMWVLMFEFNNKTDRCVYYLKPVSELTGKRKALFLKIAQPANDAPSHYKDEYNVNLYLLRGEFFYYLFVGEESELKRLKDEFIRVNSADTEFEQALVDTLKPETQKHFGDIMEHMNYDELVNYITESLQFDAAGQRVLDDGKKIADYEVDEVKNVTKQEVMDYFQTDSKDPVIKYLKQLKLAKKFTYVWIQFIKLLPHHRGHGRGSEIMNHLALSYPPGTLMALSAEEVSSGKTASSLAMLKRFYKQNGFTLIKSQGKTFGFRVV